MSKRKKITDVERFYIEQNPDNLSNRDLADRVQCAITVVEALRSTKGTPDSEVTAPTRPEIGVNPDINVQQVAAEVKAVVEQAAIETDKTVAVVIESSSVPVYNGPKAGDFMGKDKNKRYGFAVMTPAAAEMADEHAKFIRENKSSKHKYDNPKAIHKPKG